MLKERTSGTSYNPPDEHISARSELIPSLPKAQLVSVYKNWMKRLNCVVKHWGVLPQVSKMAIYELLD
jgi:hypothetical protein